MAEIPRKVIVTSDIREGDSLVIYPYGTVVNVVEDLDDGVLVTEHGHLQVKLFFGEFTEIVRFRNG